MSDAFKLKRIPSLKTVKEFRNHLASLGVEIPCDEELLQGPDSPLARPIRHISIRGKKVGNRIAVHPMEGWDGTLTGGATEPMLRRWKRFGESGAKLIYGGEAMAVRPDGRANPNQLIIQEQNRKDLGDLRKELLTAHRDLYGTTDDLVIGYQLTHSGRFCRPVDKQVLEPQIAYRHPILDRRFGIDSDDVILTDSEVEELIQCFIKAARIAYEVGADFVDIKHCHGYLLHEFLGAHTRPGKYGGSFENRTRILREIVDGIRADGNPIDFGVRLSAFDMVPFRPDPEKSQPGRLGPGIPEDYSHCLPYQYGFGVNVDNPLEPDLREPKKFVELCVELGIKILNLSCGSPYYNPHIQRPAAYPPSDGYQPAHDPLIDVARQIQVVRDLKDCVGDGMILIGTGYSYLQEFLPMVSQYVLQNGWADMVGIGRMVLSYPHIFMDAMEKGRLEKRAICRTFSDCTTAPRNGIISGCFPLDSYYIARPEARKLKDIKKALKEPKR